MRYYIWFFVYSLNFASKLYTMRLVLSVNLYVNPENNCKLNFLRFVSSYSSKFRLRDSQKF